MDHLRDPYVSDFHELLEIVVRDAVLDQLVLLPNGRQDMRRHDAIDNAERGDDTVGEDLLVLFVEMHSEPAQDRPDADHESRRDRRTGKEPRLTANSAPASESLYNGELGWNERFCFFLVHLKAPFLRAVLGKRRAEVLHRSA